MEWQAIEGNCLIKLTMREIVPFQKLDHAYSTEDPLSHNSYISGSYLFCLECHVKRSIFSFQSKYVFILNHIPIHCIQWIAL